MPTLSTKSWFYGVLALLAALLFLVAIDRNIYATTLRVPHFAHQQFSLILHWLPANIKTLGRDALEDAGWRPRSLVRKAYSIVGFALIGLLIALVRQSRSRSAQVSSAALCATILSLLIEVFQRFTGSSESFRSNILDVLCGTLGGGLGALLPPLYDGLTKLFSRSPQAEVPHESLHVPRR